MQISQTSEIVPTLDRCILENHKFSGIAPYFPCMGLLVLYLYSVYFLPCSSLIGVGFRPPKQITDCHRRTTRQRSCSRTTGSCCNRRPASRNTRRRPNGRRQGGRASQCLNTSTLDRNRRQIRHTMHHWKPWGHVSTHLTISKHFPPGRKY